MRSVLLSLVLMLVSVQVHADDMKSSKNFWMNTHSNYLEFTVLVTDLNSKNTWAKDGYIRAYDNENRSGTALNLIRVYTRDMGNDYEPLWEVFATNMIRGSKAFMQNTMPMGDADPEGALSLEETTFYVNKGSSADDTFVIIDYYYSPELAGKTWYFYYEYEHNSSGKQVMSLGSAYCSETVDCSHFDTSSYTLTRPNLSTIQVKLPAMPNDIEQRLQNERKHVGQYDFSLRYTLFDGSVKSQTASFECQTQATSTGDITIPVESRNFKTIDITVVARDALEADGGSCFWDDINTWELKDVFPHVPQPSNLGIDYLQFDRKVDLTWNSFTAIDGLEYIESSYPYVYRVETDQYGTPKSGQSWSKRDKLSTIGDNQNSTYTDKNVASDGKYYKYLVLNVPKEWENKSGLSSQELQSPSEETINSLGHAFSDVVSTAAQVTVYNLRQDITVKDKVKLLWNYSRVPVTNSTVPFEVWRCESGTTNWSTYATDIKGDSNPKSDYTLSFTDADLPNNHITYDYKVVLKLNNDKDQFESNVVTAGLLTGTTVTDLKASKGVHTDVVRVEWKVNQVGTGNSTFEVTRRYAGTNNDFLTVYHTTGTSDSYTYEDKTVEPGHYYEYQVKAYSGEKDTYSDNNFQNMLTDVGFCQARGVITGRVTFGSSDTSVEDVRLTLRSSDTDDENRVNGYSQRINGVSSGITWDADSSEIVKLFGNDKDYTVQMFVRPDSSLTSDAIIAQIPYLGTLKAGQYKDGKFGVRLEKKSMTTETQSYKYLNHWRHMLYWADSNKATGTLDGETCYKEEEMENIASEWVNEGFIRLDQPGKHYIYGNGAYISVFHKTEELNEPVTTSVTESKKSLYDANLTIPANVFTLLSFQSNKGVLGISSNDKTSDTFTFLSEETNTDTNEDLNGYELRDGFLITFDGNFNKFFDDYPLVIKNSSEGTAETKKSEVCYPFSVGGVSDITEESAFLGNITDVRVWDHVLSDKEKTNNNDRVLGGRETGLMLYWPMDEGIDRLVFDASYSNDLPNGRHAIVGTNINVSRIVPSDALLSRYAITNTSGEYTMRGIPFIGSGSTYTLTPSKSIHVFSPTSRNGFISASNLSLNNFNFTDESSFTVRGKVTYHNTNIPVDSVTFKVDGTLAENKNGAATTDSKGEYEISVPIGKHRIEAYREGHLINSFPEDGTTYDFHQPEIVNFVDKTLVNVTGRVNGGFSDKNAPLGFRMSQNRLGQAVITLSLGREAMSSFNYIVDDYGNGKFGTTPIPVESASSNIESHTVRGGGTQDETRYIHITTDAETGEFSAYLPPLKYKVESITFVNGKDYDNEPVFKQNLPTIDATNTTQTNLNKDSLVIETGEVKYYDYAAKFIRQLRVLPTISVSQEDMEYGGFGAKDVDVTLDSGEKVTVPVMTEDSQGVNYLFGHPLFVQRDRYSFDINVSERYKNLDTKETFTEIPGDAIVSIMNNACLSTLVIGEEAIVDGKKMTPGQEYDVPNIQVKPDKEGNARYHWYAGWPNLADGFLRNLSIGVKVDGRTTMWQAPNSQSDALDLVVLGGIPTGSNFVTRAPDHVDMVIRRPPGSTASTTFLNDTIYNYYHTESSYDGESGFGGAFVSLVPSLKVTGGPIGFLIATSMRPYLEHTIVYTESYEEDEKEDSTYTYTVSTMMKTPSSGTYTQNNGDTYIGRGTNILFSKGRTVGLFKNAEGVFELSTKESLCFANEFSTTFVYPQQYIEDVQIPNWKQKIQSLLTEVSGDLSDNKVCPKVEGKIMYYTNLKEGDPRRGTKNIDDCWSKEEYEAANKYPSYRMVSGLSADEKDLTDSIQWCNNQIKQWQDRIADNEREKLEAFETDTCLIGNYSIAYGTSVSQTTKTSNLLKYNSDTHKRSYTVTVEFHPMGNLWNNAGGYAIIGYKNIWGSANTTNNSITEDSQFSWTISDAEPYSALSVNVYKPKDSNWGPIFRTMGGQTCNPYEGATYTKYHEKGTELDKATMRIENPKLSVDGATTVTDVPTGGSAQFTLEIMNDNEVNVPAVYVLDVIDGSNPNGAILTIDGDVLSKGLGGRVIKLKSQEKVKKTLIVKQGSRDVIDYNDIGLILHSQKDTATVSDPVYLSVHFVPSSAHIEMSVDRTVLNKELFKINKGFIVTLSNLDRQDNGLKGVRLQYRRKGIDAWTLAKEWKVNPENPKDSLPSGNSFPWSISMPDDGVYELRAQTYGTYDTDNDSSNDDSSNDDSSSANEVTYETDIIEVTQDLSGPQILGMPYPNDGTLTYLTRNDMHIRFNEDINSNALSKSDNFRIEGYLNNAVIKGNTLPDIAVQLNGDEISTQSIYDFNNTDIALEGWFYRQSDGTILSLGTEDNMLSMSTHDNGQIAFRYGSKDDVIETGSTLPADIWNYVAISYVKDPENEDKGLLNALYINADNDIPEFVLYEERIPKLTGTGKLHIGGDGFVGMSSEIALWNTNKQTMELYQGNKEVKSNFTPGLAGYWRMDEGHGTTVVDRINSRNIILPTESWYINNRNLAAHLDSEEPIGIDISRFAPRQADNYALELWFRGNDVESNQNATLMSVDNRLRLGYSDGNMVLTTYDDPGNNDVNSKVREEYKLTETNYNDNQWHHLALNVRRGTGAIAYIDGRSVKTIPEEDVPAIDGNRLYVGGNFSGDVDEVRIWNAIINGGMIASRRYERLDSTYSGLIGYFPMESIHRTTNGTVISEFSLKNFGDNSGLINIAIVNGDKVTESVNSPALSPGSHLLRLDDIEFDFTVSNRELYFSFPDNVLPRMDGNEFTVTVSNIKDNHGNISEPIIWKFNTDFCIWDWSYPSVSITKDRKETRTELLTLIKLNSNSEDYEIINLPTWMTTDNKIGTTTQNLMTIPLTVLPSAPMGTHDVYIYVSDKMGIKRGIVLEVTVTGDDPGWSVDPNTYESNMIVIGQLYVGDKICEYEKSYIAAFDDMGVCRGTAHPEYMSTRDAYYLNMNIFGSSDTELSTGMRDLTFKIYDASTGTICPIVQITMPDGTVTDTLTYSREALYGTYDNPVLFKSLDGIEQLSPLKRGWNWVSIYVNTPSTAIGDVIKGSTKVNNIQYVKSQNAFATAKSGAFIGELTDMYPGQMYKIQLKKDMTYNFIGTPIDVTVTAQTIHHDYNWIGTLSSEVMSPAEAFADLNPEKNDVVKNRSGLSMYRGDGIWEGTLKSIVPGEGYIYFSRASNDKTFHYPVLGTQTASYAPMYHSPAHVHNAPPVHYTPVDPYTFPDNMNVIAVVVKDGQLVNDAEVGAFINGECRGAICANEGSDYYFLTVMGSSSEDQNNIVELRVFAEGMEYVVDRKNTFINDNVLGNLDEPYVLDLDEATGVKSLFIDSLDDDGWYTLQGYKLEKKPVMRGVYIHNGVKVVIE